jgi:VCBS repeat-containing protein
MLLAQAMPQADNAPRINQGAPGPQVSAAGVLTLARPQAGETVRFDARDSTLVDFQQISGQCASLAMVGNTLKITFANGSSIELLNFTHDLAAADLSTVGASENAPASQDGASPSEVLAQIGDEQVLPSEQLVSLISGDSSASIQFMAQWCTSGTVGAGGGSGTATGSSYQVFSPIGIQESTPVIPSLDNALPLLADSSPPPPITLLPPNPGIPSVPEVPPAPPPNSNPVVTGGNDAGGATEDVPPPTASGTIDFTDADLADAHVVSAVPQAPGYLGSFTASITDDSTGDGSGQVTWNFAVDNDALQFLAEGQQLIQTYTVMIDDGHGGTTTQVIAITITGTNDAPVITAAGASGEVTEGDLPVMITSGTIGFGDVDLTNAHVASVTPGAGDYLGTFVANVTDDSTGDGVGQVTWVFVANNALRQSLRNDETLVQTYTVEIDDGQGGTTTQLVTITIHGTNDAAVITGDTTGSVIEAGGVANGTPGVPTATGDLNSTDVDDPNDAWTAVSSPTASDSGYGTYTITDAGVWSYMLNDSNLSVQALNVGDTLTDTFTATTVDGTSQVVTITITGSNDAALIFGDTNGSVVEAGGVANGTPGTAVATGDLNAIDVDNPNDAWTAVGSPAASANGYGTYTLTAAGVWSYQLDNGNVVVQALNVGNTLTDSFTVSTVDGTSRLVTITITGTNDAAVITGTDTGAVVEAGGVANGTPGTPTATGNLDSTDVDNLNDVWTPVGSPTASTNGYGSFTLSAAGAWTYILDNSNAAVQALNVGDTLTDTFLATTVDGTTQLVSITIQGSNDAAVISGAASGSVVEAGGVANGTPGTPVATGGLSSTDIDNPNDAWTAVSSPTVSANGYGAFTLTAAGVWSYTLDNSNVAVQALNVGNTLTDTFLATTVDGTSQLVTITITGSNDAALITGTDTGAVVEASGVANGTPGTPTATGDLNSADVDNLNDVWAAVGSPTATTNAYGTFTLTAAGAWTYILDNGNAAVQALNVGDTLTDTFTVSTIDGTAHVVTITIAGTNDAAVIAGDSTGAVVEAGGVANSTPGIPTATGDLNSTDVDNPNDAWTVISSPTASANGYGAFTLTAAGVWTYSLDNSNASVQALNTGQTLTDSFTVSTVDGTSQPVTITISGTNDAAVITGTDTGAVVEAGSVANGTPGTPTATGDLNSADVDNLNDVWTAVGSPTATTNGYGSFTLTAAGAWTYILDNSNTAVQALNVGDTLMDTFTATTIDGTAHVVTVTIAGTDDTAVITGDTTGAVVEAGGVANSTPGTPTATGDLNSADVDNPTDAWTAVTTPTASINGYGTFTLTAAGAWTYTLDNSNASVQALNVGNTLNDTFLATTVDGTAQVVTVTITGTNDAAVISGDTTGTVIEAGGVGSGIPGVPVATGDLDSTDVDNPPDSWNAVSTPTAGANGYGTFTLTGAGTWTYVLDNSNAAVQALNFGDTLTDSFIATTVDGTTQVVTITITGTNDAAVVSGDFAGTVLEAGGVANGTPGIPAATGDLDAADVDNPPGWNPVSTPTTGDNGYGTYTLTAAGVWTYTLDDSNPAVQALNAGDTLTDTFTATTVDGTSQLVTITIDGANDNAIITGDTAGSVVEAGGVANATPGTPTATGDLNSTDVDNPNDVWIPAAEPSTGGFGLYTLTAAGAWNYTLDNTNAAVQALNVGDTLIDSFTVSTVDGTSQLVTITITGANDAAVISGTANGSVTEAGGVANGTPGVPTATGDLNSTDVDNPNDSWTVVSSPIASTNGYGSFTLTAAGVWTYTLDNSNATVQALNAGDTLTDTFTTTTVDGTAQVVTVMIVGSNDAAVISGVDTGSVTEAGGVANGTPGTPSATGDLNATDVDNPNDTWTVVSSSTASTNGYGAYTLTAAGVWNYTLNNTNAAVQGLNAGDTLTDTFTATTVDGTSQLVTITITGANDAAVISGVANGSVTEAGGVANGTPGAPTATGDLNSTDVDNPNDAWTVVSSPTASANAYGNFTVTAAGVWTYTLDNSNAAVQALNAGDTLTDTFTTTTVDGTAQVVTIMIVGSNDAAVISGTTDGAVTEAGGVANGTPGAPVATGDLNSTDVDNPNDAWTAVGAPTASNSGHGTYTLTAAGAWNYTLDNTDAAVQALNAGDTLTDTFTATTVDGTSQFVTITITGSNDAAVIAGDTTGFVVEAGGVANGTPGTPTATGDLNSTDVDNPADAWTVIGPPTPSASGYGTYTLTAAGVWTYTLDDTNTAVQALNAGDTLTDTFTVTTVDGTPQTVTVTIFGTNDAAIISGDTTGAVIEAGGIANGTPGTPIAAGDLNATDTDNPTDTWIAFGSPTASTNGYGTFTLTAAGTWEFTLDNTNAAVQALNVGDTLTDSFIATTVDGTSQVVTITIQGTNDAAVITGPIAGQVDAKFGSPFVDGDLNATDFDNPNDVWTAVNSNTVTDGGYGTYTLTADGVWEYKLDRNNPDVKALAPGETLTDTFSVFTIDGTAQQVTITINGENDAAIITGDTTGTVIEAGGVANGTPGTPVATGDLNAADVDNPPDTWNAVTVPAASVGGFGAYTLTVDGVWTYTLNNSNPGVEALNVGQTLTDAFIVTTIDGTQQVVTITIEGTNDAAVISGVASGAVIEAGGVANDTPGTPTATGDLNSNDFDNINDAWTAVGTPTASANGYGTYTMTNAGVWTYTLDNSNTAVQALNVGDTLTDTFTVTTVDGTPQVVTITITGTDDAAVITGDTTGAVVEAGGVANGTPGTATATGDLASADVDNPNDAWAAVTSPTASTNGYGTFTLTAAGVWSYTLDNSNATVQALNVGDTLTDTFSVTTVDGTAQVVTITITGTNDAAVITGTDTGAVVEAGGVDNGTPGTPIATGDLNSTDVDNLADAWTAVDTPTASTNGYGIFELTADGTWIYLLNNDNATVQALNVGDTLTDSFTVTTVDGTAHVVTVTIAGTNDAAVITGTDTGAMVEAGGVVNSTPGTPTATGDLNSTDVDNLTDTWTAVTSPTASANGYGTFTLTAAGVWTYTLDNNNATVQELNAGQTLADTFTVTTVDGTAQVVTITITGTNDAAVISGDTTGAVVEAGEQGSGIPGVPVATGNLNSTDVDNAPDSWNAVTSPTASANGYGTFELTAAGTWIYLLDNNNATVQALNTGDTLTDSFIATTVDGTTQVVTITISGTNDAAVVSGDFAGTVLEAGGVANGTSGIPVATGDLDAADDDNPPGWNPVSTPTAGDNGYGTYTLTAAGVWIYTLDDNNPAVQALNAGDTLTDTFTATTVGGTPQLVTITIDGENDSAVITGGTTGSVVEAGGVANATPGSPTATGDLNSTDVDNLDDVWTVAALRAAGGLGTYTLSSTGAWTYTLDNSNATVQALNVGQIVTDSFIASTIDGTSQIVTITINGANDAAVITGVANGSVTEAGGVANGAPGTPTATGNLNSTDVDNPNDSWTAVSSPTAGANGYGTFTLTAAGVWTYTLNNNNATVQALNAGGTLTDSFTVTTVDGTTQVVSITINGANDAAVITGTATGTVIEAGGVANGTPGTPTATGNLNSTDVDNPNDAWTVVSSPTASANGYGTFTLTAAGAWTYTLNNSNATVQALNVGATLTDNFTVTTVDGTTQVVSITINGANDAAVISGIANGSVTEAGGVANGTPGIPTATGDLNAADVDNPNDAWTAVSSPTAGTNGYGSFTMTAAGVWTYTLDNSNGTVQALPLGGTLTDTFTVATVDGTTRLVTITINGANDAPVAVADSNAGDPVVEAGVNPGNTPFAGDPSAAGNVLSNDTDIDSGDTKTVVAVNGSAISVGQPLVGTYGTLTLSANGTWSYALNNADPDTNGLAQGQTATDTFTYTMADANGATSSSSLAITITGTNDAPDITVGSGDSAGTTLTETDAGLTGSGTLTVVDPDLTNAVTASVPSVVLSGTTGGLQAADVLGMLSVTSGSIAANPGDTHNLGWTFNSGAQAFDFLNTGEALTLTYTVQATDGSATDTQAVTITINGTTDLVANADTVLGSNLTTVIIPWSALLANDSDPNATIVGVTDLVGVTGGTIPVTLDSTAKTITFTTPNVADSTGNTFTYTISNGLDTAIGTVNVGVLQVNTGGGSSPDLSAQIYDFSYITTGAGTDTYTAGPGTDYFFGGDNNDIYRYAFTGSGGDLIDESILGGKGTDTIQITTASSAAAFTALDFQRVDRDADGTADDLFITSNGQTISVINEFDTDNNHHVETMSFTSGGTFAGYSLGTSTYSIDNVSGGQDIVAGTSGNDNMNSQGNNDLLFAGAGDDIVDGNSGNDLLVGGTGNDTLYGGGNDDTYVFALNDGIDTINEDGGTNGGGGADRITIMANGAALSSLNFADSVAGAGGNLVIDYNGQQINVISEFSGDNHFIVETLTFFGGATYAGFDLGSGIYTLGTGTTAAAGVNTILSGDGAANTLTGNTGQDLLFGNGGNDNLSGGGGNDLLSGGVGDDTLNGGTGNDVLIGGAGNDTLTGGGGTDRYAFGEAGPGNVDTIVDYQSGSTIDLSSLLDNAFGPTDNAADFARLVQNGSNITVQVDVNGPAGGANWTDVAVLAGYGTAGPDLVNAFFEGANHPLTV